MKVFLKQTLRQQVGQPRLRVGAIGDAYTGLPTVEHAFDVCTNLRPVGIVRCAQRGELLYIQLVYLDEAFRGQGLSRQILSLLERRFEPEVFALHAGSLLEHENNTERAKAEAKLIAHWLSHGFSLVCAGGNLLVKQIRSTDVSAEGGAACSARPVVRKSARVAGASS